MRSLLLFFIPILLASCTGNHYHDGKYKANVFTDASLSWVRTEQIELDGNDMYYRSTSIIDNTVQSEFKTSCNQYPDRIEFKNKDGITCIARFDQDGNLKFQEYTYKKIMGDTTERNLSERKSSTQLKQVTEISKLKIDEPQTKGTFFIGTKSFCSSEYEDDCIEITITRNGDVTLSDPTDEVSPSRVGHLQGSAIVTANGKDLLIKYKPYHLYMKRGDKWIDFNELKDVSELKDTTVKTTMPHMIMPTKKD